MSDLPTPFDGIEDLDSDESYVQLAYDVRNTHSSIPVEGFPFGVSEVPSAEEDADEDVEDAPEDEGADSPIVIPVLTTVPSDPPKPPKRGRGRPPKNRPAPAPSPAVDKTDDYRALLTAIAVENPADKAWLELNARRTEELDKSNALIAVAEQEVSEAKDAEDTARAEVQRWNTVLATATAAREVAEKGLAQSQEESAEFRERAASCREVMSTVEGYLSALTGGKSGRVGAVRVTVIDNKTHIDPT
ncbi:MAG: hypothetical protein E6R04_03190 [Spirochaetes bacterium]|nr:MAG: hypothetical protein E6R04_03190 [Spirochaetota bacterium]